MDAILTGNAEQLAREIASQATVATLSDDFDALGFSRRIVETALSLS